MADGKWIPGLQADLPAVAAARHVLQLRLNAVKNRLPQAVFQAEEDVEHVHQLRVSTRRAGAALRIFQDLVPRKVYDRVRKKLRKVRRAAGAARDWDVFLEALSSRVTKGAANQRPGLDLLIGLAHGQRMAAQPLLVRATQEPPLQLEPLILETLASLRLPDGMPGHATLRDLAVPQLTVLLHDLEEAASGDLNDYVHLHQVRILGKRMRYAMEVFESCFERSFREVHYVRIEEMQDILGKANDSHVAAQKLTALAQRLEKVQGDRWKRYRPGIVNLLEYHQKRLPEQRDLFRTWWNQWHASGGEDSFAQLLKNPTVSLCIPFVEV